MFFFSLSHVLAVWGFRHTGFHCFLTELNTFTQVLIRICLVEMISKPRFNLRSMLRMSKLHAPSALPRNDRIHEVEKRLRHAYALKHIDHALRLLTVLCSWSRGLMDFRRWASFIVHSGTSTIRAAALN